MAIEPYTAAFATIVGLVADFVANRDSTKAATLDAYIDWLRRHEHEDVVAQLENNRELAAAIKALLQHQHAELVAMIGELNSMLFTLASRLNGFQPIAAAIDMKSLLSDQAISILHQMNLANAKQFIEAGKGAVYILGNGIRRGTQMASLEIEDSRFVLDDLQSLLKLECLHLDHSGDGTRIFIITRLGAEMGG